MYRIIVGICVFTLIGCAKGISSKEDRTPLETPSALPKNSMDNYVEGELIVSFLTLEDYKDTIKNIEKEYKISFEKLIAEIDDLKIGIFKVPKGKEKVLVKKLMKYKNVKSVELNYITTINNYKEN
ncbi:S8 family serine peptidase [Aquimarina rhabdastrellae]